MNDQNCTLRLFETELKDVDISNDFSSSFKCGFNFTHLRKIDLNLDTYVSIC